MMKTKDIDKKVILDLLRTRSNAWTSRWVIAEQFPESTPPKLILSAMRSLIKRGLVEGCCCGCRGDFEITDLGRDTLR